eukprot:gene14385-biopygen15663
MLRTLTCSARDAPVTEQRGSGHGWLEQAFLLLPPLHVNCCTLNTPTPLETSPASSLLGSPHPRAANFAKQNEGMRVDGSITPNTTHRSGFALHGVVSSNFVLCAPTRPSAAPRTHLKLSLLAPPQECGQSFLRA